MIMTAKQPVIKSKKIDTINVSAIVLGKKKQVNGSSIVPLIYSNQPLIFQTEYASVSGWKKTETQRVYLLHMILDGVNDTFFDDIEKHVANVVEKNGSKLFTEKNITTKSIIDNNKIIRLPVDLTTTKIVDEQRNEIGFEVLNECPNVKVIIELNLWIDKNRYGLYTIIHKIMVRRPVSEIDFCSDDEPDNVTNPCDPELTQNNRMPQMPFTFQIPFPGSIPLDFGFSVGPKQTMTSKVEELNDD